MKIYILFNLTDGPWGGGNQFLKAMKKEFQGNGAYAEKAKDADVILFNSHHCLNMAFKLKKRFPKKIFIHRVDGPIGLYRGRDEVIDKIIFESNDILADGTVFQSIWSKEQNKKLYDDKGRYEMVAYNAPDGRIFNEQNKKAFNAQER